MVRRMGMVMVLLLLVVSCLAQTPQPTSTPSPQAAAATDVTNLYAVGVSYNNGGTPNISGTGLWAHKVSDAGTYAFTVVDAITTSKKPFTVQTNFGVGVAQKALTIGKVPIYIPTSAGVSYSGGNTGWAWSTGALASIPFKGQYRLCPNIRLIKSSVGQSGYQPVVGFLVGWGQ